MAPTAGAPVIDVTRASKRYGQVRAVDDVSLRVGTGEIYALLGLNGAGKTTLIRMLLGLLHPDQGRVSLWGMPVGPTQPQLWSGVGYLVETPAAYPELTVRENLEVMRRLRHLPSRTIVEETMQRLRLDEYADRRARTLSLGNAQRLGLAKALLPEPDLLILDEPANGLDPAGVVEIRGLLRDLVRERGTTILLSSHVLAEVSRLATRIGILHQGHLVRELTSTELSVAAGHRLSVSTRDNAKASDVLEAAGWRARPVGDTLILAEESAIQFPDRVAIELVRADCAPTRLVVEHDDLETYFLNIVNPEAVRDA